MSAPRLATVDATVSDLRTVFADRLLSVVAYGPHFDGNPAAPVNLLALVTDLMLEDLQSCARFSGRWEKAGAATPLILPRDEFVRSLDAFPLEYAEIMRTHTPAFGSAPFQGVTIATSDLRRACEAQVKSHLVHLREGFIEAGGHPAEVAHLVAASAPAFAALLRNVARLCGVTSHERTETTRLGAQAAGIPDGIVSEMLALEQPSRMPATDPARHFPAYLHAVEQLARAVDGWHEQPRA